MLNPLITAKSIKSKYQGHNDRGFPVKILLMTSSYVLVLHHVSISSSPSAYLLNQHRFQTFSPAVSRPRSSLAGARTTPIRTASAKTLTSQTTSNSASAPGLATTPKRPTPSPTWLVSALLTSPRTQESSPIVPSSVHMEFRRWFGTSSSTTSSSQPPTIRLRRCLAPMAAVNR